MRLNTNSLKRTVAVLAAVCTLGTCCIAGSIAYAQGETQGADTGNIDATKKDNGTSITIHKYKSPATSTKSDGSDQSTVVKDKQPVKGVEFTLYKVQKDGKDIDLAKPDGWKQITSITDKAKTPSDLVKTGNDDTNQSHVFSIAEIGKGTTNSQGLVKFTKTANTAADSGEVSVSTLGMSLYVVKETNTDGAIIGGKHVTVTGRVDPFFVTLPLANSTTKTWIYDVHVYPKNDTTNLLPTKTASDPSRMDVVDDSTNTKKDGTRITWKITIPLPAPAEGQAYDAIGFSDKLSKYLTFDEVKNVKLVKYNADSGEAVNSSKDLTVTTHYTVTPPSTGNQQVLKVELNASGLSEAYTFYSAAKDAKQIVKLEADVVTKVGKDVKNVKNIANTWADNNKTGNKDNPCNPDSDTPGAGCDTAPSDTSYYGTLKVIKEDNDNQKRLNGAKFDVYEITDGKKKADVKSVTKNGETYNFAGTNNAAIASKKVASSLETKTVGNESGIDSVKLFVRKKSDKNTTSKTYCIVETEAPAGYKAVIDKPICYDLVEDSATTTAATANVQTVKDPKATAIDKIVGALPMTGARGLVLLTAFGIVGLGGTLFYIITRRRKEQEEA